MADGAQPDSGIADTTIAAGRFTLRRRIGAGSSGIVYEAHDRERGAVVAIKALSRLDATSLLRFKSEFRMLADLSHPNLLAIHELLGAADQWYLVMDFIDGCDLRRYLRPESLIRQAETEEIDAPMSGEPRKQAGVAVNVRILRIALRQLAAGIAALHAGGRLHLDLKPSNVLVDRSGRVVICDFGLSVAVGQHNAVSAGTLAYVAPEQASGEAVSEASDWYSFGVILYEALTERLPYDGTSTEIFVAKARGSPTPPSRIVEGIPRDLEALCLELLEPKPDKRPRAHDIMQRLGITHGRAGAGSDGATVLFGRQRELAALRESFAHVRRGRRRLVQVSGESGVGKSVLVQHFLGELPADVVVLTGRCYERESVPFKLLDGVIDELTRHLLTLPAKQLRAVVPARISDLTRLFPVMRRIEAVSGGASIAENVPDPQEAQHRASLAWRELIGRIAAVTPVVFAIDDVQWGDLDSVLLLSELFHVTGSVLVIVGYRDAGAENNAVIAALRRLGTHDVAAEPLQLQPLSADVAVLLARAIMGGAAGDAARVAREARGNPFLVTEFARYLSHTSSELQLGLDDAVGARVAQLPAAARELLRIVALAARPLELALAVSAAGPESRDPRVLSELRAGRFVRLTGIRETDRIECYHDAIRETVARRLPQSEVRTTHLRLAHVLEAFEHADPEEIAEHYLGGGDDQRAAHYTVRAAEQAMTALAFERAARLYRAALALPIAGAEQLLRLRLRLGDALASAGRGREAAEAFLAAAELSAGPGVESHAFASGPGVDALELRRRAAEHFFRSGYVDAGLATVGDVLAEIGLRLARTPTRAVASLALRRAFVRMRGTRFTERAPAALSQQQIGRIDACWSVALGLGLVDNIRGADFQARHLLAALRAGEPYRIARALCLETAYTAGGGGRTARRTQRLATRARELAAQVGVPHAIGLASGVSALACFLRGEWRAAVDEYQRAERIFRDECVGAAWELASVHLFTLASRFYLGELRELAEATPVLLREALARGDLYAATSLRSSRSNVAWLVRGEPELARAQLELTARTWSRHGFHLQHHYEFLAHTQIDLYLGDGASAWRRVREIEAPLRRSFLLRVQTLAIETFALEGRAALAAWRLDRDPNKLATAQRCSKMIDGEAMPWGAPLARLLRAGVAAARDQHDAARSEALEAATAAGAAGMRLHEAVAKAIAEAVAERRPWRVAPWLAAEGVVEPERLYAMVAPGPWQPA